MKQSYRSPRKLKISGRLKLVKLSAHDFIESVRSNYPTWVRPLLCIGALVLIVVVAG